MTENKIRELLKALKEDRISLDEAYKNLKDYPFQEMGFAKIDHHRSIRKGFPEVVLCQGKKLDHILKISQGYQKKSSTIMLTRATPRIYLEIEKNFDSQNVKLQFYEDASIILIGQPYPVETQGTILVLTGGTADIMVAEEAAVTAEIMGNKVIRGYDVGVAGLHRLLSLYDRIQEANVIIAVAGMEGALASVVGGLAPVPVIAVPTSVGYGSHLNGLAALLSMLNSCAPGISVVNVDNGFGAGYLASLINKNSKK